MSTGTITQYGIGEAIGAALYIEALETEDLKTEDLDAFVFLPPSPSGLALLTPIYMKLTNLGGVLEREHVRFGEWPFQIATDANELLA